MEDSHPSDAAPTLSPSARQYFRLIAADIIRELISSHGAFRVFNAPAPDVLTEGDRRVTFREIQERLDEDAYDAPDAFVRDMRQLFYDAVVVNPPDSALAKDAAALAVLFDRLAARLPRFLGPSDRDSALARFVELQKYRYLMQKTSHQ
jgi:hypothetical protein